MCHETLSWRSKILQRYEKGTNTSWQTTVKFDLEILTCLGFRTTKASPCSELHIVKIH